MCKEKPSEELFSRLNDAIAVLHTTPDLTESACLRTQLRLIIHLLRVTLRWLISPDALCP